MNKHQLSVSLLVCQAARNLYRNLYRLEFLTANFPWTDPSWRAHFWRTRRMMVQTPDEAAAWLPALAVTVQQEPHTCILEELTHWPLPEPLPPEALPWRTALIRSWKRQCTPTPWGRTVLLAALVRLDRQGERLPEWLKEARRALDLGLYDRRFRLAALASWRPRPGNGPPHGGPWRGKRRAARAWVRFWEAAYKSPDLDGLIATVALLHLAEGGWLPSGPSAERLREEFRRHVQQVRLWPRWRTEDYSDGLFLSTLLAWVSPERRQQDIKAWLELTRESVDWKKRKAVWGMLAAWQREGVVERGGIGRGQLQELSLLPDLARALEWERYSGTLLAMAGYVPRLAEVSTRPEAARAVVAHWEALSRNGYWEFRLAAWVARWNLRRAGVLTAEEQARFGADYVEVIGAENNRDVLLVLARITPPGTFPLAIWTRRLSDKDDRRRLVARLAIHGWLVDMAGGGQRVASSELPLPTRCSPLASEPLTTRYSPLAITRRQVRQALRRAGQEVTGTVAPFVNIPREVLPDFQRLHEIETALAAGQMPPPPDAGKGKRKRMGHLATLARLPESHPRADGPARHHRQDGRFRIHHPPPFPEDGPL